MRDNDNEGLGSLEKYLIDNNAWGLFGQFGITGLEWFCWDGDCSSIHNCDIAND